MAATGALVFLSLPLLVGLFMDTLALSEGEAGSIASVYFATYLLASATAVFWIGLASPRHLAAGAYLTMAAGLALAGLAANPSLLLLAMCVAGIGGGMLFSLGVAIVAAGPDTARNYGWLLVAQQLIAAAFLYAAPLLVIPRWGMSGALISLALLSLLMMSSLIMAPPWLESAGSKQAAGAKETSGQAAITGLVLLVLHFAGLSALWAFVERIGVFNQLSASDIGTALSLSMFGGLAGAVLVTQLGDRVGRQLPLWIATVVFVGVCMGYAMPLQWPTFVLITGLLSFAWNFVLAYQMGIISELDHSGRRAVLIPAAQGLGAVIGPALGGWVLELGGQPVLLGSVALLCLLTISAFSLLAGRLQAG
jgi:predicted MFS family arabinose efflux permease